MSQKRVPPELAAALAQQQGRQLKQQPGPPVEPVQAVRQAPQNQIPADLAAAIAQQQGKAVPAPEPQQPVKQANQMPPELAARVARQGKPAVSTPAAPISNGIPPTPAVTDTKAPTPQRPAPKPSEPVIVPVLNAYVRAHLPKAEVSRSAGVLAMLEAEHAHSQSAYVVQTGVYSDVTRALGEPGYKIHQAPAFMMCCCSLAVCALAYSVALQVKCASQGARGTGSCWRLCCQSCACTRWCQPRWWHSCCSSWRLLMKREQRFHAWAVQLLQLLCLPAA